METLSNCSEPCPNRRDSLFAARSPSTEPHGEAISSPLPSLGAICHKRDCLRGFNPSLAMFVPFVGSGFVLMSELMVFSNMI